MNHRLPPPFPSHHFFSPNPSFNPNFNSTFFPSPSAPPPPPPQLNASQLQPVPDLPTSLSVLTDLLDLSNSTLLSLSSLLSRHPLSLSSEGFSRCPFNPNHLLPPESLFFHSLHCPAPVAEDVRSLLDALHYPKTLKPEEQLIEQNKFAHPLTDPHAELCFSLEDYVDFGSNFFYHDCPGVVSSSAEDGRRRMFSLPGVLSVECANFASGADRIASRVLKGYIRLLPSELWVVRREIEQWTDFPKAYSYSVLRVLLCVEMAKEPDLLMWVITNSPHFGVIIDSPMRDHIYVLFRLCVKVMVREAYHSYECLLKEDLEKTEQGHLNPETMSFSCAALGEVLSWLTTQLSVLYGEANAKPFTIGMVKHLLLTVASSILLYPLDQNVDRAPDEEEGPMITGRNVVNGQSPGQVGDDAGDSVASGGMVSRGVFVYQVAAAIAALHERSLLEEKINALRSPQQLTAYQRVAEHDYLSKKAQEERQKRQNYRPLIEHDGLPVQRSHDKDGTGRNKTKEELLAEERDYKRRRMSYRGKKLKRNTKEVMRDIIEEHMEAIRQAGGIGCFDKGVNDGSESTSKPQAQEYGQNMEFNRSTSYEYESSRDRLSVHKKHLNSDYSSQVTEPIDFKHRRYDQRMQGSYEHPEHARDREASVRNRHRGDSYHRSPGTGRERIGGHSRDQRSSTRNEADEGDSYARNPSGERNYGQRKDHWSDRGTETEEGDSYPRSSNRERNYRLMRDKRSDRTREAEQGDSYPRSPSRERKYGQARHSRSDRNLETNEGDSYPGSPDKERYGRLKEERSAWRNKSEEEYHRNWSSRRSTAVHSGRKDKQRFEDSDSERRKRYRKDRSDSVTGSGFDDRYAPSRSPDM